MWVSQNIVHPETSQLLLGWPQPREVMWKESRVPEEGHGVSAGLCALPTDGMGTRTCHQVLLLQPHHSQVCWVSRETSTPWVCWGQNPPLGRTSHPAVVWISPLIQWQLVALPQVPAPSCCRC